MPISAIQNNTGFSLVEVMIALVISLLVMMALMQTALVSIDANMRNVLREEAVLTAEERMNDARERDFDALDDDPPGGLSGKDCPTGFPSNGVAVEKDIRKITSFDFCTNTDVVALDSDNKQVTILVGWRWKGEDFDHQTMTIVRKR